MDGLHGQLTNFFDRYKQDRQSDRIQEYEKILMDLKADLAYIKQLHTEETFDNKVFDVRAVGIEKDLNTACAFLKALMEDFQNRRIDGVMGCEMIFTLLTIYSQLFNEFCCWQYYAHHAQHPLFSDWKNILENVGNLPNSNNVFLTPGGKPNLNCYVVNVDVEGNEKIPGGSIFPNP